MKNITLIILFATLLIIPIINASISDLGTFKQNDCVLLKQTCSDCTYNNISSVNYPNGEQALGNSAMTKSGTEFTYNYCSTSEIGKYIVNGYGDLGGTKEIWGYEFSISGSGEQLNGIIVTFIILGGVTIYILVYRRNQLIGSILFMLMGIGVWSQLSGINGWIGTIIFVAGLVGLIYDLVKVLDVMGKIRSST